MDRPGDHEPDARHGEVAVHREAEPPLRRAPAARSDRRGETGGERRDAGAGAGRAGQDRAIRQSRAGDEGADFLGHRGEAGFLDAVALRDRDDAAPDPEEIEDRQMLAGLGHDAVVGRHDEECPVHAGGARHHGAHQPLVARHVDEAERRPVRAVAVAVSEARSERDAARLLLGQPVGVDAGQRLHEGSLAVVDMTGGGDDDAGAHLKVPRRISAAASGPKAAGSP